MSVWRFHPSSYSGISFAQTKDETSISHQMPHQPCVCIHRFFQQLYGHYSLIYRVTFLTGPAQKSSKYGTGPTQ